MKPEQLESLRAVFRDTLGLETGAAVDDLAYRALPAWDSIGHMRLVAAIETAFDVMLDTDEVIDLSSFAKAAAIVGRHLGGA
ncbi:putative Acyl carrier protein [Magnetospirillum gryphiswaldense MSR-1 v2]|uniref:Acyl carrier protein n=1 Tax=Magnetospirillum gryphiswaldense (strain DSM 6361 / JCM 21280 / NBRC 15271 / MSR-1) TaxID=431944 RepID=V6F7D0_MAGGM|nr:acyl carrier protein [Magnetospirillum gryphiswaldense]CDL01425.1 putative Acyl carrier protein [Magnetospirillum gryphiswaldense MSR-1 v2]